MPNEVNCKFWLSAWSLILWIRMFDNKMGGNLVERIWFIVMVRSLYAFAEICEHDWLILALYVHLCSANVSALNKFIMSKNDFFLACKSLPRKFERNLRFRCFLKSC